METPETTAEPVARRRVVAAVAVAVAAWAPAVAALVLWLARELPDPSFDEFLTLHLVDATVWGAVSALLIARRPNPVGVILAATAVGSGISALAMELARAPFGPVVDPGISLYVLERSWMPGVLASFSVLPLLLSPRRPGRGVRALVAAGVVVAIVPSFAVAFRQSPGMPLNPLAAPESLQVPLQVVALTSYTSSVALAVVTWAMLVRRLVAGASEERRGAGWLVLGQSGLLLFLGPIFLPWLPLGASTLLAPLPFAPLLAVLFMAAAVVVVALGGRLWGIDTVVNRALVDVLLFAVLLLGYGSLAYVASEVLPVPPTIAGVAGAALLALLVEPVRRVLQRRVDALVYGDAADPAQLVARLGRSPAEGRALPALVAELAASLRLGLLEVRSAEEGGLVARAGDPAASGPATMLALRGPVGVVGSVEARGTGRVRVDRRTRRVLERISGLLAVALQLDAVNRGLGEARERAVTAGEEERRMVRRELDGGFAPVLEEAADRLEGLLPALRRGEPAARTELGRVRAVLTDRTAEVRDLARTLLPGALDAGDLDTALRELASRFSGERLVLTAESRGGAELEPAHQNALHHLAAEAVLLLRRSSGVRRGRIALEIDDDRAVLDLAADAPFTTADTAEPVLASLADRAAELGGGLEVGASGACLRVAVPR